MQYRICPATVAAIDVADPAHHCHVAGPYWVSDAREASVVVLCDQVPPEGWDMLVAQLASDVGLERALVIASKSVA